MELQSLPMKPPQRMHNLDFVTRINRESRATSLKEEAPRETKAPIIRANRAASEPVKREHTASHKRLQVDHLGQGFQLAGKTLDYMALEVDYATSRRENQALEEENQRLKVEVRRLTKLIKQKNQTSAPTPSSTKE